MVSACGFVWETRQAFERAAVLVEPALGVTTKGVDWNPSSPHPGHAS